VQPIDKTNTIHEIIRARNFKISKKKAKGKNGELNMLNEEEEYNKYSKLENMTNRGYIQGRSRL